MMPRMPGIQVDDPKVTALLSSTDRRQMAHAMGETLAAMHQVTSNICGRYDTASRAIKPFDLAYELAYPFPPSPADLAEPDNYQSRTRTRSWSAGCWRRRAPLTITPATPTPIGLRK